MRLRRRLVARHHPHMRRAGVMPGQAVMQLLAVHARRQQAQVQGHGQDDALAERAIRGHEDGALRQAGVPFDLWRVLVRQAQSI
ncbi:hypothetical protein D3C72_2134410 [compost metagenome]